MEMFDKTSFSFLTHFVEKRASCPFYSQIINSTTGAIVHENLSENLNSTKNIHYLKDFPSYMQGKEHKSMDKWKINKINTYMGSAIILNNYSDLNQYLRSKFNSNRRSKFRTYKKRLENSFDITYKTYYGEISIRDYEFLFEEFHKMMVTRFEQKQTINKDLKRWKVYREIAYPLIQKKQACLFVIYSGTKPISICFNILLDKILFAYIRAYDIDYAKFYIGFTDFINQLNWCFENKIEVFDMLKGDYEYKTKWTDSEYFFEKQIIYNSNLWMTVILAKYKTIKIRSFYRIFHYLKKWKVHLVFKKITGFFRNTFVQIDLPDDSKLVKIENLEEILIHSNIEPIDINDNSHSFLRKFVYDYLYSNNEFINDIEVLKIIDSQNTYLIKGIKCIRKITIGK